jgi:hypothetical protein
MTKIRKECEGKRKRVNEMRANRERGNMYGMDVTLSNIYFVFLCISFDFRASPFEFVKSFDMSDPVRNVLRSLVNKLCGIYFAIQRDE